MRGRTCQLPEPLRVTILARWPRGGLEGEAAAPSRDLTCPRRPNGTALTYRGARPPLHFVRRISVSYLRVHGVAASGLIHDPDQVASTTLPLSLRLQGLLTDQSCRQQT